MGTTSTQTAARRRARERLAAKHEAARRREQFEVEAVARLDTARGRRDEAELAMAAAVTDLLGLGNTVADVAALTDLPEAEVRRLRRLARPAGSRHARTKTAPEPTTTPHPRRGEHTDQQAELEFATGRTAPTG